MINDQSVEREEYVKVSWDKRYADVIRQIEDFHGYKFHKSITPDTTFFIPRDPDKAFRKAKWDAELSGMFRRIGNVYVTHRRSKIVHEGTLYLSEHGTWVVINPTGFIAVEGWAILGEPLFGNLSLPQDITIRKHKRIERFEDIL